MTPRLLGILLEIAGLYADAGRDSAAGNLLGRARPHLAGHAELQAQAAELTRELGLEHAAASGPTSRPMSYGILAQEAMKQAGAGSGKEAERLLERALKMALTVVGPDDPDIAALKLNLAAVRRGQGSLIGVPALLREALRLRVAARSGS